MLDRGTSQRIVITSSEVHNPLSPGGRIGSTASLGNLQGIKSGKPFNMLDGSKNFNAEFYYGILPYVYV